MNNHSNKILYPIVFFVYTFLYVPIFILILHSFNQNPFTQTWHGFTLEWYAKLFQSSEIIQTLKTSLLIALCATSLSIFFSVCFVLWTEKRYKGWLMHIFYAILAIPEIIIAVSLLNFLGFAHVPLNISSIIAGHTLLGFAYAIPIINTRYQEIDKRLVEAAYDLGATDLQVFWTIIFPLLTPTIISAALLIFTISLDDFLISFFCSGGSEQTLPLYIFSMIRAGATPVINALSTILLCFSAGGLIIFSMLQKQRSSL